MEYDILDYSYTAALCSTTVKLYHLSSPIIFYRSYLEKICIYLFR